MSKPLACTDTETSVGEASARMAKLRISSLIVTENGRAKGIVTERDILEAWGGGIDIASPVSRIMSSPVITAHQETDWQEAYHLLAQQRLRHLLVTDDANEPAGIVSETDFRRHLGSDIIAKFRNLDTVMSTEVLMFSPETPLSLTLKAMAGSHASCVVIAEQGKALGVFTERDAAKLYTRSRPGEHVPIHTVMSAPPLTVFRHDTLPAAFAKMQANNVRHLVVVDQEDNVLGILSEHDIVGLLENQYLLELGAIKRKVIEERQEADIKLEAVFDAASLLFFLMDTEGRLIKVNQSALALIQQSAAQVEGRLFAETAWWADGEEPQNRILTAIEAAQQGKRSRYETMLHGQDGREVWLDFRIKPVFRADQDIAYLLAEGNDITHRKLSEDALRMSEKTYRGILNSIGEAVYVLDQEGRFIDVNQGAEKLYGYPREVFIGRTPEFLSAPGLNDLEQTAQRIFRAFAGEPQQFEYWGLTADGRTFPKDVRLYPGEYFGTPAVIAIADDISEKKRQDEQLRLAASVYENSNEAMMVTDAQNRIVAINPAFTQLTGYDENDVLGKDPAVLSPHTYSRSFYQTMWESLHKTGYWEGEVRNRRKNGDVFDEWLNVSLVRDDQGLVRNYVSLFYDISERKRHEERLWQQANYDPLTGLPNRRLLRDRLQQELRRHDHAGRKLALLYIDLDRFKEVNDTLGHEAGDQLLVEAAQRISARVRMADTVARLGGDEFAVVMPELGDLLKVEEIALAIVQDLTEPFHLGDETLYLSASLGITLFPDDGDNIDQLLRNADQAMYAAKASGRSCFRYFTNTMQQEAQHRMQLGNDLRSALAKGQFEVYYQPIVDLQNGQMVKAEALLRWHHPGRGLVGPDEFIPIAEEIGLISDIGDWVFREAANTAARWCDDQRIRKAHCCDDCSESGTAPTCLLQISVNKSPRQFLTGISHEHWVDYLRERGIPPECIVIEITEGLLLDDRAEISTKLREFRENGVQVAIDDFGTGYSAMSYLKKFQVDYLKIDRSFVCDMAEDESNRAIVEAVIMMAHRLGIKVVAEGVETEAQYQLLKEAGCDYGQGFLFGHPQPAAKTFAHLLHSNAA